MVKNTINSIAKVVIFTAALFSSAHSFSHNTYLTNINNLEFDGTYDNSTMVPTIIRGPYLQSGTPTSIIIKWRTADSTDSKVWFGDSPTNLVNSITAVGNRIDHEVTISGLTPNTVYYYAVGDGSGWGLLPVF